MPHASKSERRPAAAAGRVGAAEQSGAAAGQEAAHAHAGAFASERASAARLSCSPPLLPLQPPTIMCLMPACPRVPQAEATSQRAQHVISAVRQQLAEAESQLASDLACPPAEHQQRAPGLLDLPPEVCCNIAEQLERRDRQAGQPGMRACSRAGPAAGDNSVAACCPSSAAGSAWRPPAVPFGGPLCAGSATTSLCCGPTSAGRRSTSPGCAEFKVSWHGARGRAADALGQTAAPAPASGPPALTVLPLAPLAPLLCSAGGPGCARQRAHHELSGAGRRAPRGARHVGARGWRARLARA